MPRRRSHRPEEHTTHTLEKLGPPVGNIQLYSCTVCGLCGAVAFLAEVECKAIDKEPTET